MLTCSDACSSLYQTAHLFCNCCNTLYMSADNVIETTEQNRKQIANHESETQ